MAVHTILPTTNLKWDDIRDTLNSSGGNVTNDVSTAFKSTANINKWAKYKPVKYDSNDPYSDSNWWNGLTSPQTLVGGLFFGNAYTQLFGNISKINQSNGVTNISNDTEGFLYKLAKQTTGMFDYVYPTSYLRFGDYRNYAKNSINPNPIAVSNTYKYTSAGAVNLTYTVPTQISSGLTLSDLKVPSNIDNSNSTFSNLYVGMLIYNDSLTDVMFATQTDEQKSKGTKAITLQNNNKVTITGKRGKYNAITFYSTKEVSLNNFTTPTPIVLFPCNTSPREIYLIDGSQPEIVVQVSGKYIDTAYTKYQVLVNVINNTASTATISQIKITIPGMILPTYGPTGTIEPFGQIGLSKEITFPKFPMLVETTVNGEVYTNNLY